MGTTLARCRSWLLAALAILPGTGFAAGPLQLYFWDAASAHAVEVGIPMVWADGGRDAKVVAAEAAAQLKALPKADRAVFIPHAGFTHNVSIGTPIFPNDERIIEAYAKGGFLDATKAWMDTFWKELAQANAKPAMIILDYEDAAGVWSMPEKTSGAAVTLTGMPNWLVAMYTNMTRLGTALGKAPVDIAPADFVKIPNGWGLNRDAIEKFNAWQASRRSLALKTAIVDRATAVFGETIPASNFADQRRDWMGYDDNNWRLPDAEIPGTVSSPVTYLEIGGQRYGVVNQAKPVAFRRALNWVDRRNDVRSAVAAGTSVAPWYSNPDYGLQPGEDVKNHRLMWAAGILHDRSVGVDAMLMWSEGAWSAEEIAFAKPVLRYAKSMAPGSTVAGKLSESDPETVMRSWIDVANSLARPKAPPNLAIH